MEDNNNDDTRQGLYNEFESEIVKAGNPEAYFDENDLIEIFDYASDMDNYIVKMEVLLYGARHYPGSEALATRRAWFYSSFGEMEAAAEVNSRVNNGGFLNRLLALRAASASDTPDTRAKLDEIVDATVDFGDEDVIQLVDYCAENNMLDWVEENRPRIEAKCSYPPTLIYEYADRAEELGDLATAKRLFEELTMLEPFTVDFWVRLANVQFLDGTYEDSLASCDYALAIDGGYIEALRLKGRVMYRLNFSREKIAEVFRAVLDMREANESDVTAYAATIVEMGRTDEAVKLLEETIIRSPLSQMPIDLLMNIDFELAVPYILAVSEQTSFTRDTIVAWAKEHLANGRVDVASSLVRLFCDKFIGSPDFSFLTELWYFNKMYREVVDIVDRSYPELESLPAPCPGITFPYLMSLIRLGETDKAKDKASRHMREMDDRMQSPRLNRPSSMMRNDVSPSSATCLDIGYAALLRNIINALSAPSPLPPDTYDPMLF
ncbi:MAG: hypothetical protein NC349_02545 [Paenibacillus sp.]|nr:hypothetical protein [Paenibacillus sp.]